MRHDYSYYLTFKHAIELGGKVMQGAKALTICYWNFVYREKSSGELIPKDLIVVYPKELVSMQGFLKEYKVFLTEQIEGIE